MQFVEREWRKRSLYAFRAGPQGTDVILSRDVYTSTELGARADCAEIEGRDGSNLSCSCARQLRARPRSTTNGLSKGEPSLGRLDDDPLFLCRKVFSFPSLTNVIPMPPIALLLIYRCLSTIFYESLLIILSASSFSLTHPFSLSISIHFHHPLPPPTYSHPTPQPCSRKIRSTRLLQR